MLFRLKPLVRVCSAVLLGLVSLVRAQWGTCVQPQIRRLKSPGPPPGDSTAGSQPDGLPVRTSRPARDFSADAAQDAVILSVQDLAAAQEAVSLARRDQEDERRAGQAAGARDSPEAGTGSAGPGTGTPLPPPPAGSPADPPEGHLPARRPAPGVPEGAAAPGPGAVRPAPAPRPAPPPSWGRVLLTTVQLWAQRRLHLRWPAQVRWRVLTVAVLAAVLAAAGAISIALTRSPAPAGHTRAGTPARTGRAPTPAALAAAAAARTDAARWVAAQVSADAIVSCDPQMCALLQAHGIPAARLLPLGPGNAAPLGSDLIVSTAAVRSEFGARLTSVYAPVSLASFGTGSAQTAVRVVAPDGAAAYLASLRADVAARASAGSQLLQNPRLHSSPAARRALAAGQVDARLLTAFAALATMHTVDLIGFPAAAAGASPGMPLRVAEIAPAGPGTRRRPNTMGSLVSFLRAQLSPYRPAGIAVVRLPGGRPVLRVGYGAPSPLGLLGKG